MASGKSKQYGLILSSKGAPEVPGTTSSKKKNVFGDDSDSDSEDGGDWVKKSLKREAQKGVLKRTTRIQMQKALEEDPTVFQYDEVYEDIEQKKEEAKVTKKGVEKKPRYIQALLQTAEKRKKENERRVERQVQKEREEEGEQFADKESFVTSSYRQKLEEFKKQEEEEKRMERLEAIGDVTKQKDLTGFYRHLYRQTMGEKLPGSGEIDKTEEEHCETSVGKETQDNAKISEDHGKVKEDRKKDRQYRKRRSKSSSSDDSDTEDKTVVKKEKNVDADSDFTGSSSSSESEGVTGNGSEEGEISKKKELSKVTKDNEDRTIKKRRKKNEVDKELCANTGNSRVEEKSLPTSILNVEEKSSKENNSSKSIENSIEDKNKNDDDGTKKEKEEKPVKIKIDVWVKRTVGQAFDDAVQRFYERKAARAALRKGRA